MYFPFFSWKNIFKYIFCSKWVIWLQSARVCEPMAVKIRLRWFKVQNCNFVICQRIWSTVHSCCQPNKSWVVCPPFLLALSHCQQIQNNLPKWTRLGDFHSFIKSFVYLSSNPAPSGRPVKRWINIWHFLKRFCLRPTNNASAAATLLSKSQFDFCKQSDTSS